MIHKSDNVYLFIKISRCLYDVAFQFIVTCADKLNDDKQNDDIADIATPAQEA